MYELLDDVLAEHESRLVTIVVRDERYVRRIKACKEDLD